MIKGSNTDSSNDWTILDTRSNITSLDNPSAVQTFEIQIIDEFYRYLRIRQTGCDTAGSHFLTLSSLEYFGSII